MPLLTYRDHTLDPAAWARELGISREAVELYLSSDVIDLHVDSFIWTRIFGYDLTRRHGRGLFNARLYSQVDFPRVLEARVTGAIWVITTNPWRTAAGRARAFVKNRERLRRIFAKVPEQFAMVTNAREYRDARASGKHAAFIGIQGGNALDHDARSLDCLADGSVLRVTLVHLTSSSLGTTSSPLRFRQGPGLTALGKAYVERLNELKVFVDLAHISPRGFWDAIEVHDKAQPLFVTHTGVAGVTPHWRNLDDDQLRAVARLGGTVGVMYHGEFLGDSRLGGRAESIARHLRHIVKTVGEDHASLGSDWDGSICTPRDMPTCVELPRLVDILLRQGLSPECIRKILGQNFLRVVAALRG
jgi:membrane dipeptidase